MSSLGDIVLASGLPSRIKQNEPDSKVVFVRGKMFNGIFDYNPHVDIEVSYEKENRQTQPSLSELAKNICEMADGTEKIEIHFADLQNNKRSYALLYTLKQHLRNEIIESDLYLSHLELEKYRGAKVSMVWGKYLPLSLSKLFGTTKKPNNYSSIDNDSQDTKKIRALKIRNMLRLPYVAFRYFDTIYGKGTAKRMMQKGGYVKAKPEIWTENDYQKNYYLPLDKMISDSPTTEELGSGTDLSNIDGIRYKSVALCPGAAHKTKKWPKDYWINLAAKLIEKSINVVVIGGPGDRTAVEDIASAVDNPNVETFISKGSIKDTVIKISECDAIITGDTSMAHIAYARRVKSFVIFGSTVPELGFAPKSSLFRVIQDNSVECRPCTHIGRDKCPRGHFKCMQNIKPDNIMEYLRSGR